MALPAFELHRPTTVEEATALLDEHGDDAALHCGGTELLLVMKLGLAPNDHLIDTKGIGELQGLTADDATGGGLRIGATVTHRQVERSAAVRGRWPGLAAMTATIGNVRVRNTGTLAGNLCFAEPHSDPATALLAADASIDLRRGGAPVRSVAMEDFVVGPLQTALEPGELLVGVRVPEPPSGAVLLHRKIRFHERAAANVALQARVADNRWHDVRLAVGAVGTQARLVPEAAALLDGTPADAVPAGVLDDLAAAAVAAGRPVDDSFGTAEYKTHLLRVLLRRTLAEVTEGSTA